MKKISLVILTFLMIISCRTQDYDNMYSKKILTINDCMNKKFILWVMNKETGLELYDKKIKTIKNNYTGGVAVGIQQLLMYYEILINDKEYNYYKLKLQDNDSWVLRENGNIDFLLVTKHELSCSISSNKIMFGLRNIDVVYP